MARKFSGASLLLATHNEGKAQEIQAVFMPMNITIKTLADFNLPVPEETGVTFLENAKIKAQAAAIVSGIPALADDSGFCVRALGDAPGVYSADWAQQADGTRSYLKAMEKINALLSAHHDKQAFFAATLVLAWPDGHCEVAEGRVKGHFVFPPCGDHGFGYDPCFIPEGQTQTFAQLGLDFKKNISHRARALEALLNQCFR